MRDRARVLVLAEIDVADQLVHGGGRLRVAAEAPVDPRGGVLHRLAHAHAGAAVGGFVGVGLRQDVPGDEIDQRLALPRVALGVATFAFGVGVHAQHAEQAERGGGRGRQPQAPAAAFARQLLFA